MGLGRIYFETLYYLKRISTLVVGALLVFGSAMMLIGAIMIWRATSHWPHTEGKLLKFDLQPLADWCKEHLPDFSGELPDPKSWGPKPQA